MEVIGYINTDLVVVGTDLLVLDQAFKEAGLVALGELPPEVGRYNMGHETDFQHHEPEPNIERFLAVIGSLNADARRVWEACERREFDIGYQSGTAPREFTQRLSGQLLARIASVNADLRLTLYTADWTIRR